MVRVTGLLLTILLTSAPFAVAQSLDDAAIENAIKTGQTGKLNTLIWECVAEAGTGAAHSAFLYGGSHPIGSFHIVASTNVGRIAFLAAQAKRLYKPLTLGDVPDDLREPGVFVSVDPQAPKHIANVDLVAPLIEHLVLKSKQAASAVVQPQKLDITPVEWGNVTGGKVVGTRALATFALKAVMKLPPGDIEVVLITDAEERKCKIGTRDRARLFK
jgi:hypothetical protein